MACDNYYKNKIMVFALLTSDKNRLGLGFDYQEMHELKV